MLRLAPCLRGSAAMGCIALLTGCSLSLSPLSKRSAVFGNAASLAVRNSSEAYQTVQQTTYKAQVSQLVLDFDEKGFDRSQIKQFPPAQDLKIRQTVLSGLQQYGNLLADVAGDRAFAELDAEAASLSKSLQSLSTNAEFKKLAPSASEDQMKGFATAVDTLGRILIERKRRRELPGIIKSMQEPVERLCSLLEADIGESPIEGRSGTGLREQLWLQYNALITNQQDYISENGDRMSPGEKAAEIAELPRLVADQQAADNALAQTKASLKDLAAAHRALLQPAETGTFRTRLETLIEDGRKIADFYSTLGKS